MKRLTERQRNLRALGLLSIIFSVCGMGLFIGFAYAHDYRAAWEVQAALGAGSFCAICASLVAIIAGLDA